MRLVALIALAIASVIVPSGALGQLVEEENGEHLQSFATTREEQALDYARVAHLIVERTNTFRSDKAQRPVAVNPRLQEAAQYLADYMARTDKYGHTVDGKRPAQRAAEHGYEHCIVSENIAYAYHAIPFTEEKLARQLVEGWINSPQHRRNMLDPDVTNTSVAVAHSQESGNYYAVQMFGRPKSMSINFTITNQTGAPMEYQIGERTFPLPPRYTRAHQQCRPSPVTFRLSPGDEEPAKTQTVQPERGDRFLVTIVRGELRVDEAGDGSNLKKR
jgi:uncharacterized protein YkwD